MNKSLNLVGSGFVSKVLGNSITELPVIVKTSYE